MERGKRGMNVWGAAVLAAGLAIAAARADDWTLDLRSHGRSVTRNVATETGLVRRDVLSGEAAPVPELSPGDTVTLLLFDDTRLDLRLDEAMPAPLTEGYVFTASPADGTGARTAVVIADRNGLTATVEGLPGGNVVRVFRTEGGTVVEEREPLSAPCEEAEPPGRPSGDAGRGLETAPVARGQEEYVLVDVLVAFDNSAQAWASRNGGMTNFAETAVQRMNVVLANTGLDEVFHFRLVGVMAVNDTQPTVAAALTAAKGGQGAWAGLHERRDAVGADVVSVLVDGSGDTSSGKGYSLKVTSASNAKWFSESAYNACQIRYAATSHTMSHEIGHHLGCGHSNRQATSPGPQSFPYSSGYHFTGADGASYGTIMAYQSDGASIQCTRIPFFSSPDFAYAGVPVGTAAANDNTRVLRQTAAWAADWRERKIPLAKLELGADSRSFTADAANSKSLDVSADVAWTAESGASWLTVATAGGKGNGKIVYHVAANEGTGTRKGKIKVGGGWLVRTFTVTQLGKGVSPVLALSAGGRSFTADAASGKELGVTANVSWTAQSGASWLSVNTAGGTGNGSIGYSVAENEGTGTRTGKITVGGCGLTQTFTVTQLGKGVEAELELGASDRRFTADAASSKELGVTANVSWMAVSGASWLTVKTASGSGNGKIVYNVAANAGTGPREGTITVSGCGLTRVFTVTQDGFAAVLDLSAESRSFGADAANSKELGVTANVAWTAKSSVSWLTVKTAGGSGNGKIVYNVGANTGKVARTGTIAVSGGGLARTFTVTQAGVKGGETRNSPVPVPYSWLEGNAGGILAAEGGNYEAAAVATAANGRKVWECYVAGVSATNANEDFKAVLVQEEGKWVAKPVPDLGGERKYAVEGASGMGEGETWGEVTGESRFFRVKVEVKREE